MREQVLALATGLCLGTVAVVAIGAAVVGREQAADLITGEMAEVAATMSDTLERGMFERFREAKILAGLEPLRDVWGADPKRVRTVLEQMQASFPDYAWIGYATADGTVRASTKGMLEGATVSARPWFIDGLKSPAAGDVHEAKLLAPLLGATADGEPFRFVDVSAPVTGRDGKVAGVLGAHLSWRWAEDVRAGALANLPSDQKTEIWVLSANGATLLGPKGVDASFAPGEIAALRAQGRGAFTREVGGRNLLMGFAAAKGFRDYPGLGWTVVASRPAANAFAAADRLAWRIAGLGVLVAIVGLGIASVLASRFADPIRRLTFEAERLGRDPSATSLPRLGGSRDVAHLSAALRALLLRVGDARARADHAEQRAELEALRFNENIDALRVMADTDSLTGQLNRRAFLTAGQDAMEYYKRYGRAIAVLIIDIDWFKRVNDRFGHPGGDVAIRHVSDTIAGVVRTTDKVARFGGEEFVVLLREIGDEGMTLLAERIREAVRRTPAMYDGKPIAVTISIGCALVAPGDRDVQDLIARADRALYVSKERGRNRTTVDDGRTAALAAAA